MENKLFMYEGTVPLPPLQAESSPSSSTTVLLPTWQSLSSAVGAQPTGLHCASGQSPHCLYNNLGCEKSTTDYVFAKFDSASALSSIVSSPAGSTSKISCDSFVIGELIGKPGTMSNSGVQISANSHPLFRAMTATAASHITSNLSYNELLNSPPPKLSTPMVDHLHKLEYNMPVNSVVSEFSGDPGFAERAARFSRFGSRSFHGRTAQFALNSGGAVNGSMQIPANAKLARVSSAPSINAQESHIGVQHSTNSPVQNKAELSVSQEGSSISEQIPSVETGPKAANAFVSSRKRKANSRGKVKENGTSPSAADSTKGVDEANESSSAKKCKQDVRNGNENEPKESIETASEDKQTKTEANPVEPPKDYIHVRARRGQATDSHSLAERVRREKISERMKILQDLVPGCNKVIGKALMLDEIINYVQSLQRQVEFLSMKLATLDYKADPHSSKDMFQSNSTIQKLMLQPLDSSASVLYGHQYQKNPTVHGNIMEGTTTQYSVDPLGDAHLHTFDGLSDHTLTPFCGDDLQTIVQLGFGQNMLAAEAAFDAQDLRRENLVANMKVEL